MGADENAEIVRRGYEAFNSGDVKPLTEPFDESGRGTRRAQAPSLETSGISGQEACVSTAYSRVTRPERRACRERVNDFSWSIHQGGSNHGPDGSALVHGYRQRERGQDGD